MDKIKYVKLEQPDGSYSDNIPLAVDADHVDVNGNTLTNVLGNKADNADIDNLQTEINSLASGSPLVASSTSEMTDTTRVYVNTTDGHWYYHNGTTWTDGGVYQAVGIENNSISSVKLSNELKNNIAINTIDMIDIADYFELGEVTITTSGWTYFDRNNRVRIKQNINLYLTKGSIVIIPPGRRMYVGFQREDGTYGTAGWTTAMYVIQENGKYTFLIGGDPESSAITNIKSFLQGFKIISSSGININDKLELLSKYPLNLVFSRGAVTTSGLNGDTRRISSKFYHPIIDENIFFSSLDNDILVNVYAYKINEDYSSLIRQTGWQNLPYTASLDKEYYYIFTFRKSNDAIIGNDIPTFLRDINITTNRITLKDNNNNINNNGPILFYHRGGQQWRPENSIPAFNYTKTVLNSKYFETDIHETADGVLVVAHDRDISRMTNGTGNIDEMTFSELQEYYIKNVMYISLYDSKLKIITAEDMIKWCANNGMCPIIEIKETVTENGLRILHNLLKKYNMIDKCYLTSFVYDYLIQMKKFNNNYINILTSETYSDIVLQKYYNLLPNAGLSIKFSALNQNVIDYVHYTGGIMSTYVINDLNDLQVAIDMGIDMICTDKLLYQNKIINMETTNLYYEQQGNTFTYTIPYTERYYFEDVIDLTCEVYYSGDAAPIINIGPYAYTVPLKNKWNLIFLQYIPVPPDVNITISLSGTDCQFLHANIKRHRIRL